MNLTGFQKRVAEIPEEINLALLGGRGGGKSTGMALLALRHAEVHGELARMIFVRRSYPGLRDFEQTSRDVFGIAYGATARYSANDHVWRLPRGGFFELAQLDCHADLQKFQGRSITTCFIDEVGQYASPELPDLLRGNMRAPRGVPTRTIVAANPGGPGQTWVAKRWILGKEPWKAYKDAHGSWWMWCPSTVDDNSTIDQTAYRRQLEAACASDPELLKAWLSGSFMSATGSYFGMSLDESRNAVGPFKALPMHRETNPNRRTYGQLVPWEHWLAHDFGSSAPSATYLLCESPGAEFDGKFYPRGSIIVIDEYAVYRRDSLNAGLNWTAATTAEAVLDWCKGWKARPEGVGDDAMFSQTGHGSSIADEFSRKGVRLEPAKKGGRVPGWQKMKRMLADAGKPDLPGLYVSRSCDYFWQTVPFLARDQKRPEDCDSTGSDHGADAVRYGLMRQKIVSTIGPLRL